MPRQDLLLELHKNASPSLQGHDALTKAVELFEIIGNKLSANQTADILRLAERIRINSLKEEDDFLNLDGSIELSLQDIVSSDYLVDKISYWVEQIREELFGVKEAPFPDDLDSSISWIETTALIDLENKKSAGVSTEDNIQEHAFSQQAGIPFLMRDILIPTKNSVKSIWVQPGTLLYNLSRKVETISRATGFSRHALTMYILTGLEPILPRLSISLNLGKAELPCRDSNLQDNNHKLTKRSLKIEIHTADLSPKELKMIYDKYRSELKIRKTKSLSSEQVKLYYMVRNQGGPPAQGSKAFWQDIRKRWNKNPDNKPYQSWEGVYQRYKIVERKMENLFIKK